MISIRYEKNIISGKRKIIAYPRHKLSRGNANYLGETRIISGERDIISGKRDIISGKRENYREGTRSFARERDHLGVTRHYLGGTRIISRKREFRVAPR